MEPSQDESAFEWIREVRARIGLAKPRPDPNWPGIFVSDLIPPQYEAYATILGRFDARYDDIDHPLSPTEQKVLGIPDCEPLKSFILKRRSTSSTTRIRWKEMAAVLDLPYAPEINFAWFRRRMDGWCVSRLLNLFTGKWPGSEECEELIFDPYCSRRTKNASLECPAITFTIRASNQCSIPDDCPKHQPFCRRATQYLSIGGLRIADGVSAGTAMFRPRLLEARKI